MESPNFEFGHGPNSDSESDNSQHSPPGSPQILLPPMVHGIDSVGEAASNTVGLGPPGSGSTSTQRARSAKRGRTSWVWKHAKIDENYINKEGVDIGARGVCNYCSNNYSCNSNGGIGHIERHLKNKHKEEISGGSSVTGVCNFVYSKSHMRNGLALYVAAAEQPFTFGDDIRFEHFVQTCLQPAFSKVSRNTTRGDCLKAFINGRKKLITEIAKLDSTISFTSDLWSGNNNLGYIVVTAHYIDASWILQKRIIAFRLMEFPHNANNIFQCINGVFREFDIVDKVFSITFDNHTANTAAIEYLK